jgi:hypothetical protein
MPLPMFTCNRPIPNQTGVQGGQDGPPQAAALVQGHSIVMIGGPDGHAPSTDPFQLLGSTALPAFDSNVVVSGAKLS